ncbi:MAG: carboxy terminal-processing peptidase [Candidatus Thiodiazotropha sp. (ex Lucinoma borealis)]|nr:carboxy terminal-processing peptidase [Candidatus Thiodiazotropha sp. (ex Lucinoma borealis)]MCU7863978.1 carboxy terminal-processing peptidase [Candidatus Thiodiazotropha sp. (ex Lucinoma borealis)]MCU7871147.1 carboxy terminal-processing peptidase [Candidatus Thiodiazotropha sp. (ex Lucinoma borealis)]
MKIFKVILLSWLLLFFGSTPLWANRQLVPISELQPTPEQQQTANVIVKVIDKYHYKDVALDDAMSELILQRYFDALDPNRSFFLARDIVQFSRYQDKLDDYLKNARIEPAFEIFRLYRKRVAEAVGHAQKLVDSEFDFTIDETYIFEREEEPWSQTRTELSDVWRKRVKNDFLNLRLMDKKDEEIRKTLHDRFQRLLSRVEQFDSNDIFQTFINAYTLSLEPHTSYMSPSTSENFDISMRLSLEGIGAVLKDEDGYTVVQKTVIGGPAEQSDLLHAGDRIVGVGQGLEGRITDIIGWRLQDVVEQIRGPKGSVVRLGIFLKGDETGANRKTITLVRNKIKLEEQAAKSYIIDKLDGMKNYRIGVVEVPTFYRDFSAEARGDEDFRSTTRDVRDLLVDLKKQDVNGIVIDLRENGGGSLSEATELTGLFIDSGPVVQIKDAFGKIEVEQDPDQAIAYEGPLAVLVDRNSASASEIFAGAIQDYKRGIVIGEPTFGKGTVQTLVDLGRFVPGRKKDLGRLRLTMAQFFRINGGSTQHRGVVPDIQFPTAKYSDEYGERSLENALPWAQIRPANFLPKGKGSMPRLVDNHMSRIQKDPGFEMLVDREKRFLELDKRTEVSLLERRRRTEWDDREHEQLLHKNRFRASQGMESIKSLEQADKDVDADDKESEATQRIELNEAALILMDSIRMQAPMAVMR